MKSGAFQRLTWIVAALALAIGGMGCAHSSNESSPASAAQAPANPAKPSTPTPQIAASSDISGSWKWTVDAQGTQINHSAKFKQAGQTLGGTWTDTFGDQTVTSDVKEGTVKDDKVSFKVTRSSPFGDGSEMTLTFNGALAAAKDKIDGTINVNIPGGDPIPIEWHAMRVKE